MSGVQVYDPNITRIGPGRILKKFGAKRPRSKRAENGYIMPPLRELRDSLEEIGTSSDWYDNRPIHEQVWMHENPCIRKLRTRLAGEEGVLPVQETWKILDIPKSKQTRLLHKAIGEAMRELGWTKSRRRVSTVKSTHTWIKGNSDTRIWAV